MVDRTKVSVVRNVLCALAGQFVTSGGHAVTVAMRVVKIVEVLKRIVGKPGLVFVESTVGEVISEEGETGEERVEENGTGTTLEDAIEVLDDMTAALEDAVLEDIRTISEAVSPVLEDMETPELVSEEEVVVGRDVSGSPDGRTIELAGINGDRNDRGITELLLIVGTAMLIGTDEVVFA